MHMKLSDTMLGFMEVPCNVNKSSALIWVIPVWLQAFNVNVEKLKMSVGNGSPTVHSMCWHPGGPNWLPAVIWASSAVPK